MARSTTLASLTTAMVTTNRTHKTRTVIIYCTLSRARSGIAAETSPHISGHETRKSSRGTSPESVRIFASGTTTPIATTTGGGRLGDREGRDAGQLLQGSGQTSG